MSLIEKDESLTPVNAYFMCPLALCGMHGIAVWFILNSVN